MLVTLDMQSDCGGPLSLTSGIFTSSKRVVSWQKCGFTQLGELTWDPHVLVPMQHLVREGSSFSLAKCI